MFQKAALSFNVDGEEDDEEETEIMKEADEPLPREDKTNIGEDEITFDLEENMEEEAIVKRKRFGETKS